MTRTTFENVTISLTAPNAAAAYDRLVALLSTADALDAEVTYCTSTYIEQSLRLRPDGQLDAPSVEGDTSELWGGADPLSLPPDPYADMSDADVADRAAQAEWESAELQRLHNEGR